MPCTTHAASAACMLLAIWERCNHDALMHAAGLPTFAVDHQTLVEDPAGVAKRMVSALAGWGVHFDEELDGTDLELAPCCSFPPRPGSGPVRRPGRHGRTTGCSGSWPTSRARSGPLCVPERLPAPHPISLELLALAGRARVARHDAIATELAFDQTVGSRRRLVRTFLERTLPDRVLPWGESPRRPGTPTTD